MIILLGASASGKTEVAKLLFKKYGIEKVTTTTTRKMRIHEVDGKDYFFMNEEDFLKAKDEGKFVETTKYNGNYYGSLVSQIGKNKCIIVTPLGLKAYLELNNPMIQTFVLTANEKTRFNRMLVRGDSLEDVKKRIDNDRDVFDLSKVSSAQHIIPTDDLTIEEVADKIYKIYNNIN